MRKILILLVVLGLVLLASPAEAAKKHHKHRKHHHHSQAARKAVAPAKVATRAEYNKLKDNMTLQQVTALFDAPRRLTGHEPAAVLVQCAQSDPYFCTTDPNALLQSPNSVVTIGAHDTYEWYTGPDKYDGTPCWAIETEFYQNLQGVWQLKHWENWYNVCGTRYN